MKPRWRLFVHFPIVILVAVLSIVITPRAASAASPVLWECKPFSSASEVCTVITSAPAGGVQVLDRFSDRIYTLYNGNSVAVYWWYIDTSGGCGVHGNQYVWVIAWQNNGYHWAYIGDHYLKTGEVWHWQPFTNFKGGTLGNDNYGGRGSGTCDIFSVT